MKKHDIQELIQRWLQADAINQAQADYMIADLGQITSEKSGSNFINAIMVVGALAISMGLLLIIASNWQFFTKEIKLVMALLLPVLPLCFAYYQLIVKESQSVLGQVANILAVVLVGGSLALIGQIYNLEPNYTSFLWSWLVLTIPFVFIFKHVANVFCSVVLCGLALLFTLTDWFDLLRDEQSFLTTLSAATLLYAGILYVLGGILRTSQVWRESARWLRLGSASLAIMTLFIMTFEWYARIVTDAGYYSTDVNWVPLSITLNLLFIGFLLFVLFRAFRYQEVQLGFNVVRIFGVYLITKYFTLFSGMLDTGLFMILGGALFVLGAWYLEKRKSFLIKLMSEEFSHSSVSDTPSNPPIQQSSTLIPPM